MSTDVGYAIVPFVAWLIAGSTKFLVNSVKARQLAFGLIGYGGMPSNHSAIVSSVAAMVAIREGIDNPAFGVSVGVAFVVMLDANSLRRQVGRHAEAINVLHAGNMPAPLRERLGHSRLEIGAGIGVGVLAAWLVNSVLVAAS